MYRVFSKQRKIKKIIKNILVLPLFPTIRRHYNNYAEFIKMPKFERKEKRIFSREEISALWEHTDDKNVQVILFMIYKKTVIILIILLLCLIFLLQ